MARDGGEGVRGRVGLTMMPLCGGGWRGTYGLGKREKGVGRGTRRGMEKGEWWAGEGVRGDVVEVVEGVEEEEEVSGGVDAGKGRGAWNAPAELVGCSAYTP